MFIPIFFKNQIKQLKLLCTSIIMLLLYLGIAFVVGASVKAQGRRDCVIVSKIQINKKTLLNVFENHIKKLEAKFKNRDYIRNTSQFLH